MMLMAAGAHPPAPSIRKRLLWRALAVVLLGAAIGAIAAALTVSVVVRDVMESSLEETAQALVVLAEHEVEIEALSHGRAMPAPAHDEAILWQLRSPTGRLIARSHSAPDTPWPVVPLVEGHVKAMGLAVYTIPGQDLWLQVAQPLTEFERAQHMAALAAGGTVMLLGLIAAVALGWSIQQELRPIGDFAHSIESVGPETATIVEPRIPRRELAPAYSALAALLQRLQAKLRSERAFAAHAAHSLRTPLAGLTAQLEVASATAPAALAHRLALATESAYRLAGVVDALLTMARATERIRWRAFDATELATIAAGPRIEVDASPLAAVGTLNGDSDLLAVAVANLVDNSARHGARHVQVRARWQADEQYVEVEDDGPGVSQEKLSRLESALERFATLGEIGSDLGLGLTLAISVARAHGGCLGLECTKSGRRGLCARLAWPRKPPQLGQATPSGSAAP
jgi:two-component system OmpR family sensor kinase